MPRRHHAEPLYTLYFFGKMSISPSIYTSLTSIREISKPSYTSLEENVTLIAVIMARVWMSTSSYTFPENHGTPQFVVVFVHVLEKQNVTLIAVLMRTYLDVHLRLHTPRISRNATLTLVFMIMCPILRRSLWSLSSGPVP